MKSFDHLIESLDRPVFFINDTGRVTYANESFLLFTGYQSSECLKKSFIDLIVKDEKVAFQSLLKHVGNEAKKGSHLFHFINKKGLTKAADLVLVAEINDKSLSGYSGYLRLNSQLSQAIPDEASNVKIDDRYRTLYNLTFEGIVIHDKGITLDSNVAFEKMMGYSKEELIGSNIVELCVLPEYKQAVLEAMKQEETKPYEVLAKRKDGKIIHTEVESRFLKIDDQVIRVTAIRDITSRKIAENKLIESEERYRLLSNITFEGIFVHHKGIIIDANQSLADMVGYELEEIIGQNIIQMVVLPEYFSRVATALKNEETTPYEVEVKRKDGSIFFAEVEARMVNYEGETLRVTAARDITWRKETEKKLRQSEEELNTFFSQSGDGFFIMAMDNPVVWNKSRDKDKLLEKVLSDMYLIKVNDAMINQYRTTARKIQGYTLDQFFEWNDIYGRKFVRELLDNGSIKFEMAEPRFDNSIMWIEGNYVVLYDESGKVRGCCGVRREVTDRKKAEDEIKRHNEELKKANLELDNFVYRVSHDLKAPISSTKGLINVAQLETKPERIHNCLDLIQGSMDKLDSFILDILDYSRNSRLKLEPIQIDFDTLIKDTISNTRYLQLERNIEIETVIKDKISFFSDRRRLVFIFNNMISNAIRFTDEDRKNSYLHISVETFEEQAKIVFEDNGIGIRREHLDFIFEMFYRANEDRVGSGLGLYIVKEALDKLHGSIEVESEVGKGTRFEIFVPNLKSQLLSQD